MPSIDHFNLWSFDLNLLVAFDALMRERSVTRAASRLKIKQSAMSHNLSTLRLLFDDELFVRVGMVMKPTARAEGLSLTISRILEQAHDAITSRQRFLPETEQRTFTIGFSSELEVLLMPELAAEIQLRAPGIRILARTVQPEDVHRLLDENVIDIGVGCFQEGTGRHKRKLLFEQSLLCCFNPELLNIEQPLSLDAYLGQRHALVSQNATIRGCLEDAQRAAGISLDVVIAAPEFLTILSTVMHTPTIATLPARIVNRYAPLMGLVSSPVPIELKVTPIAMVWGLQSDRDPAAMWLRERVEQLLEGIEGTNL